MVYKIKNYLIIILILLSGCKKNEFTPIVNNNIVINQNDCLDTCGYIIAKKHNMNDYPIIHSELTVATLCDTLEIVIIHTIDEIQFYLGMEICSPDKK